MTKVTDYDKENAKKWFVLLKFFEVSGLLLITFGIYGIGTFVNSNYALRKFLGGEITTSVVGIWMNGLLLIIVMVICLFLLLLIIFGGYAIIHGFILINWNWAKRIAETPEGKKKRKEKERQEVLQYDEECRKLNEGFIAGDLVEIKKCKVGKIYGKDEDIDYEGVRFKDKMVKYIGKEFEVYEVDDDNDLILDYDDPEGNDYCWHRSMVKLKKKRER